MLASRSFWPSFFSRVAGRLQWDANAIDLTPDAKAWPELPEERRNRLACLLAGFCVAEEAVAHEIVPYAEAARNASLAMDENLVAWVFFLQRRDEIRHARLFDRIGAEVLRLPGETPEERRTAARELAPPALLELFEERLPALSAELADGRAELDQAVGLYHMLLEGVVFDAGQRALLDDLEDGVLPGVREGIGRVERDERWHIGFGVRCLIDAEPSLELLEGLVARAEEAACVWGDAVPAATRDRAAHACARRLSAVHLIHSQAAA
jgi:ribonucleoside-diphosphate reductase beta chain